MNYLFWSKNLNIHFGYYTWGKSLRLEAMLEAMNDLVVHSLCAQKIPAKILDLGCGFGSTALHISQSFPQTNITGVNILEAQVAMANQRAGKSLVKFLASDFQQMPFETESFDAAYALESVCYSIDENKAKLINEVARVVRPGSPFVVVDGFLKHDRKLPWLVDFFYKKNLEAWGMPSLAQIDGFCKALEMGGFQAVKTKDISWNMLPSLAFIPMIVTKLLFSNLFRKDDGKRWYIRALLLTLILAPFKQHFAYYLVTCVKSAVELKK